MNWISVVILLVALSMVNASPFHIYKRDSLHKRAVALEDCKVPSDIKLTGSVDPDPAPGTPAKSTISFTTAKDAPKLFLTTTVAPDGGDAGAAKVTTADLCAADSGLTCPVPKGKQVTITSVTDIPADMKTPFSIEYNVNDGEVVIACGQAKAKAAEGGAPKDGAPKDGAPKDGAPKDGAPKDGAPADDGAPKDGPPKDGAPADDGGDGGPPKGPDDGGDGGPPKDGAPADDGGDGGPPKRR